MFIANNERAKRLKANRLSLNLTKTNLMIFHPRQKKINVNVPPVKKKKKKKHDKKKL